MAEKWIQNLKEGTYRTQLKRLGLIKGNEKIDPAISRTICNAEIGDYVKIRGKRIHVTELLKRRACTHLTLLKLSKKRKKKRKK